MTKKSVTVNRKAFHDFHLFDKFTAGMVLCGTEIKSIRKGSVNLKDSFCKIENGEMWLYSCHISPYEQGNRYNKEPERKRKLLLNKKEIMKMVGKIKKDGYTIIPIELFIAENGFAKLDIALCKGKKLYDKREDLTKKTQNRDIQRAMKNH
ncbi:MAG: SsrA-binding protein SmpB [Candidatus Gastranaerophilaceae bacterium]|jgi:SsrA-binding protein